MVRMTSERISPEDREVEFQLSALARAEQPDALVAALEHAQALLVRAAEVPPSPQPGTRLVWRQIPGDGRYVSEVSAGIDGTIYLTLLPPQNEGEEWGLHRDIGRDCNSFEAASDEAAQVKAEGLVRRFLASALAALAAPDATAQEGDRDGE